MTILPQTRTKHLLPFSLLLQQAGEPVGPLLRRSRLPSGCLEDPESLVPSEGAFRFRALAAKRMGLPDLALQATQHLDVADLGAFAAPLFRAPTLFRLLDEFKNRINTETTMATIEMNQNETGDISFCHQFHHVPKSGVWHSDLYVLQWTIKIVRLVDPDWFPEKLWSLSPASKGRHQTMENLGTQATVFGQHCTGFLVPHAMLALPLSRGNVKDGGNDVDESQRPSTNPAGTFSGAIGQIIQAYSADGWLAIGEASEVIGMSPRTVQRRLSDEQTTYRNIFDRARSEIAGELLESTEISIAEIAQRLGYGNQGNLTRAFKRWAGVPPGVYRKQRAANRTADDHRGAP